MASIPNDEGRSSKETVFTCILLNPIFSYVFESYGVCAPEIKLPVLLPSSILN